MKNKEHYTKLIKNEAKRLGFISCGISRAEFLEDGLFQKAEYYFDLASKKKVESPVSLMALAYTQIKLGKLSIARLNHFKKY